MNNVAESILVEILGQTFLQAFESMVINKTVLTKLERILQNAPCQTDRRHIKADPTPFNDNYHIPNDINV